MSMLGTIKHAPSCKGRGINPKIYPCTCGATQEKVLQFLHHAIAHCLYGSKLEIRTPDAADIDASAILKGLWHNERIA